MGRLFGYGTGEICDRLSILALKILYGQQAGKDVTHFKAERQGLLTQLKVKGGLNGVWYELSLDLAAVNSALWQGEDLLKSYRGGSATAQSKDYTAIIQLSFKIQALNEIRSELIQQINSHVGEAKGVEKI